MVTLCLIPKDSIVVPVVQEIYASLPDQESRRTEGTIWEMEIKEQGSEEKEGSEDEEEKGEGDEEMDFDEEGDN
ncbi:hypothetical protein Goari_010217 [Gossypium aridum]|uniref:Uncharacterized protein n=1 Tax=Gossypium aridum TaxID=34290 RepID=A0A7J8Y048_GOSAI|nr:hypothetical protein [Gossypium aridum]